VRQTGGKLAANCDAMPASLRVKTKALIARNERGAQSTVARMANVLQPTLCLWLADKCASLSRQKVPLCSLLRSVAPAAAL